MRPASLLRLHLEVERRSECVAVHRRRAFAPLAREDSSLLRTQALRLAHIKAEEWVPCSHSMGEARAAARDTIDSREESEPSAFW